MGDRSRADGVRFLPALFVDLTGKPCGKLVPVEAADGPYVVAEGEGDQGGGKLLDALERAGPCGGGAAAVDGLPGTADDDSTAYDDVESEREAGGPDPAALPVDSPLAVDRFGTTLPIGTGLLSLAAAYTLFLNIGPESDYLTAMLPTFLFAGTGFALADWLRSRGIEPQFFDLPPKA